MRRRPSLSDALLFGVVESQSSSCDPRERRARERVSLNMAPTRLTFSVAHCSSEDDGHLASELLSPGPGCKGWRSAQYCIYPQVGNAQTGKFLTRERGQKALSSVWERLNHPPVIALVSLSLYAR